MRQQITVNNPNCKVFIDGKHVHLKELFEFYFLQKGYIIVLLATVDKVHFPYCCNKWSSE